MGSTYIPLDKLPDHARRYARSLSVNGTVPARSLRREGRRAAAVLRRREQAYQRTADVALPEAGRWMLDNAWLIRRECDAALAALGSGGSLRAAAGQAVVLLLCRELLRSGDGELTEERLGAFLSGFQARIPLLRRELGLLPAALRLAMIGTMASEYSRKEPDGDRCGVLFTALRRLSAMDLGAALEEADSLDRLLRFDPAGVYSRMDRASRAYYLRRVEALARKNRLSETSVAEKALDLAAKGEDEYTRHVGTYLLDRPLGERSRERRGTGYAALNAVLPLLLAGALGLLLRSSAAFFLALLPLSQLVKETADRVALGLTPPCQLPRLALKTGVPPEGKTLCVISVLLSGEAAADRALRRLEEFRMASRDCGEGLALGLLCDLPESREILSTADQALLLRVKAGADELNRRYDGGFFVFSRERSWSEDSRRFSPRERKRGAIHELCRLLDGQSSELELLSGEAEALQGAVYVLTLDEDTRLEPGAARAMIGTALHPLNRPVVEPEQGRVVQSHGVLQPRLAVGLSDANKTGFARLFAPQGGGDPYGSNAGELYMDLFRSGGFAGKGLIHIRSYLDCAADRLPDNLVLSHDALEGAYLRGGLINDVELTDGFPAGARSWLTRLHRWTRGDWQNLPWVFSPGAQLPLIERWRLWDSLRRSLLPPALLSALAAWFLRPDAGTMAAAVTAALCLLSPLFNALADAAARGRLLPLRFHCAVLSGPRGEVMRCIARFILLPQEAWTCFSAAVSALWRMTVTHKNLLQWTTAQQDEARGKEGPGVLYRSMWFSPAAGCVLLSASPLPAGLAAGLLWLAAPLLFHALSRKKTGKPALPPEDRDWLLRRCAEIWRYFRDNCVPEDHFLPPDNVQFSPPAEKAGRISPTNLGLSLLSALCALKLGVAKRQEALGLCENLLSAAERMPKWKGHLYNWTDTATLQPLQPGYISTVDSGNLAGCLLAGAAALREQGAHALAARCDALRLAMDFRPLYDERRDFFRIGLIPGGQASESWYDLMESEERLTGYIAVASGQAPRKHWKRLSRAQVGLRSYRGMVSWSGTMFEYLMPELLLPLYGGSHLAESSRFAVYAQRKTPAGPDGLWGVSESAVATLDAGMHYRYRANGCAALSLSRDGQSRVIAPYGSFLTLMVSPRAAMQNLRKLERPEYMGPYGFWEAVDFTPGRGGENGAPVQCAMVHHLGMSLVAMTNVLCDQAPRRWFMSDPAMAAYAGLLQEKIPLDGRVIRTVRRERSVPAGHLSRTEEPRRRGQGTNYLFPRAQALSNGIYHLLVTESGVSRARWGDLEVYRSDADLPGRSHGAELFLRQGEKLVSLLPRPGEPGDFSWEFSGDQAVLTGTLHGLRWTVSAAVSVSHAGEVRRVVLHREDSAPEAELFFALEPALLPERDRRAHPSFARLGISTREKDGVLLLRRLARGGQRERFLALAVSRKAAYSSDFQTFPGRGGGKTFASNTGWQSECLLCARVDLPRGEADNLVTFALCADQSEDRAVAGAGAMLREETFYSMTSAFAARWELTREDADAAMELLRCLLRPEVPREARALPACRREALWALGISGDLPIHAVECTRELAVTASLGHLRRYALLRQCGVRFDLVFLTPDEGEYFDACRKAIREAMEMMELGALSGSPGGVYFASLERDRETLLSSAAVWNSGETVPPLPERTETGYIAPPAPVSRGGKPAWRFEENLSFTFSPGTALPGRCWSNMLFGGELGWAAAECGTGALWYRNARECPLLPWRGDPLSTTGPELLWAEIDGQAVSFFADGLCEDETVTYGFGKAVWRKTFHGASLRLTAFLPVDKSVRCFLLESSRPVRVRWLAPLQLSAEPEDARSCFITRQGNALTAENPRCAFTGVRLTARCSRLWENWATDTAASLFGTAEQTPRSGDPGFCGEFTLSGKAVLLCGTEDAPELLSPERAEAALASTENVWRARVSRLRGRGMEPELLPLLNGWAAYQALSCRILGRSGAYQSGGAVGFRDQLQDYVNLMPLDPAACRRHILTCCAHQFTEGDVQHWWHPGEGLTDKGVRTRCSDDLLWLPWAACEYADATGDSSIWEETVPFLSSPPLAEGERSRYELPQLAGERGTVLEHCRRAVGLVLARGVGPHGLLKIGGGDWNDSFDAMGDRAESVWLTWFASTVCLWLSERLGPPDGLERTKYAEMSRVLGLSANEAWAEDRYLRGWYGDGTPLGAPSGRACRVDGVAQSFAAFCP